MQERKVKIWKLNLIAPNNEFVTADLILNRIVETKRTEFKDIYERFIIPNSI